ncbi:sulfotransferase 1A1-like [Cydia amplana]|uniref:sulfotransferase 1A1-like n=1 Tax=Cydia amplana TaxID=1869771 RepID=UPI002FE60F3E
MADKVKIQELDEPTAKMLSGLLPNWSDFSRFGDAGYLLPTTHKDDAYKFKTMPVRPDDIWVTTFPRSGTTWTQELVWLLKNDLDYDKASKSKLGERYISTGLGLMQNTDMRAILTALRPNVIEALENAPSPRFIKNHFPLSLLPENLVDIAKVVYVARDPRDVAVSLYNFMKLMKNDVGNFKLFWNLFIQDLCNYTPYFAHIKEAWALRHHPHMLFIFYEELSKDLPSCIKRVATFLGEKVTDEQIVKLCEHLNIDNFRKNGSVNWEWLTRRVCDPGAESFIRKGKCGGWREHFDEEMTAQAQQWMRKNLSDCDLRFPDADF